MSDEERRGEAKRARGHILEPIARPLRPRPGTGPGVQRGCGVRLRRQRALRIAAFGGEHAPAMPDEAL